MDGDDAFARALRALLHRAARPARRPVRRRSAVRRRVASGCWRRSPRTAAGRSRELRMLDHEREITPDWLQREQAVGYVTYVDRFAGTLAGVRERLPYLRELGVTYLHLMPLLHARPAPNDGGYAVVDYGAVEPVAGHAGRSARAGVRPARGRAWRCASTWCSTTPRPSTRGPRAPGVPTGRSRTARSPTRTSARCPTSSRTPRRGRSRWSEEHGRWVWTTFNTYQWDLDYTNPDVFVAMAAAMLGPGRRRASTCCGWTRRRSCGSGWAPNCQNQPEVHELLQAFRAAMRIAAPAVAFKAEAIVAPRDLVPYLGTGQARGQGVRPRLPQRARWCCCGARWPRGAWR